MFPLRALPWWTDDSVRFVSNMLKWYPSFLGRRVRVLDVGGGNSSLFLLSKGAQVTAIDDDDGFIGFLEGSAQSIGATVRVVEHLPTDTADIDLTIVRVPAFDKHVHGPGARYGDLGLEERQLDFDVLSNDGIDRNFFLRKFRTCKDAILVVDNGERAANWGRLARFTGNLDIAREYRSFFRDPSWNKVLFEQQEGRNGRSVPDATGAEASGRWVTAVAWSEVHPFSRLMVSSLGLPLTNAEGLDDRDLKTLADRSPFNWETMTWAYEEMYPESLDLGLDRSYD